MERPPVPVATQVAARGSISSYYVTTATLEAERSAPVLARVEGVVRAILHEEGDAVKEGEILARLESEDYQYRLDQAAARTSRLRSQHDRLKVMLQKELATAEEFETVKHDLEAAEAEENLARLTLSRAVVRAPFAGRVVQRAVDVGQPAPAGTTLFLVADMDPLLARVYVPSKEFKRLAQDQVVELTLDGSGAELQGKIRLVSPVIDPASGTIKVTVEIPSYPPSTRPGDFAEVRIVTERHDDAVLVPRIAVVEDAQEQVVFLADADKAVRRLVKVGFVRGADAEILEGLKPGEVLVVKGQHGLKDGQAIKVLERGGEPGAKQDL
ncbi:MAG: efflux RND transporter periplasmic adaptor subunit [Myxococcales bacterium]|nr:efflux RND transporter periplasmic adaptor subunit [Myxococcales bacterium]MCB9650667.1 efflux RND transporter periplasmic adaptor subunit [Deltaproteobacteria bacterium]